MGLPHSPLCAALSFGISQLLFFLFPSYSVAATRETVYNVAR